MAPKQALLAAEVNNIDFFAKLPDADRVARWIFPPCEARSTSSRCSSSPGPAPAAARRPTSS